MSEATELSHVLDLVRTAPSDQRPSVAQENIARLAIEDIELLTGWDYRAWLPPARGRLTTTVDPDSSGLITYVEGPWVREPEPMPRQVHRLSTLILVAQFARDHLDGLLLDSATRDQRLASLAEAWEIDEGRLRKLLSSFDTDVREIS